MGRKPTYDADAIKDEVIDWISEGKTLREFCRQKDKPKYSVVYEWKRADPAFAARFAHARECGFDQLAEEIIEIVDKPVPITAHGATDSGYVSKQKNQAWARLQLLAKWDPARYGEAKRAVELSGPNGGPLQLQAAVIDGSGLDEDRRRALVEALEAATMVAIGNDQPYIDGEDEDEEEQA